ncbi:MULTISPECIES: hypothetical protein [Flavobacterium]|jgi:hypothetical protein|uniref:hypothetical protein n=1 Tax=Flavobacterium TaxID=237 RepID=UPI00034AF952|nr:MULTISPECIES: hypothetical protein [Flavobacterium]GIQ58894.1 hypothetical protein Flavo103_20300 [Flavobacterium collinsii]
MKPLKFKISPEAIRKANTSLVNNGIDLRVRDNYRGIITVRTNLNGVLRVREISKQKIIEAYDKSLKDYAAKL